MADRTSTDEVIRKLDAVFTDPKYPKSYLRQLVEKYRELGSNDLFFDSQDFLSTVASDFEITKDGTLNSIFTRYHLTHPVNSKYIQLCMKQLINDFPSLPIQLLTNAFKKHCRLYIPTGLYLNDHLNLDVNPPTFEGQPFNPAARQVTDENLAGQDAHFDKDNEILDGDQFDDYCDSFNTLHQPSSRLPPLPTTLEAPEDDESDIATLGAAHGDILCSKCHKQANLAESVQCSKAHTLCLNCLREKANTAIIQKEKILHCDCVTHGDHNRCREILPDVMLAKRIPELIPKLKQYKTVDEYPADTVQSGICPQCYFPLHEVWGEPHHYKCNTCNLDFHVE
ncbi:hypothetical protein BLNAU_7969 [Blattamonas nauphoetae]|uniref:RING-type domain-containing protein n=1 Tax=Blattamonas nauphoetae TaxID=2049346 RepID=A0ABQ9Y0B1_9EUKA|nr:hypothetical protein BLNAU_7969 [Blattamonas nauphoetae]